MVLPPPRTFHPERPWPTAWEETSRVVRLIALVAFIQFALNGVQNIPANWPMFWLWIGGGITVTFATIRIETYFARRGRLQ